MGVHYCMLTKIAKRKHKEMALGGVMPDLLKRQARRYGFYELQLITNWRHLAPEFAHNTQPIKLRKGVLTIGVTSASLGQRLQYWVPSLKSNINTFCGYDVVESVRIQNVQAFPREEHTVSTMHEPSAKAQDKAKKRCAQVNQKELREALAKLGSLIYSESTTDNVDNCSGSITL